MRLFLIRKIAFMAGALIAASASAQDFPQRPIRVIVPYAAGSDITLEH